MHLELHLELVLFKKCAFRDRCMATPKECNTASSPSHFFLRAQWEWDSGEREQEGERWTENCPSS